MAKIFEAEDEEFPLSPYGHSAFLTSLRDFENAEGEKWSEVGYHLGVEKVGNLFGKQGDKAQLVVELMALEDMPKVRHHIVVRDKKTKKQVHKKEIDDITGDERKVIKIGELKKSDQVIIPFFFNCGKPKEISNDAELIFFSKSSAYPLFKHALIEAGELPADMGDKPFTTTQEELKEALEGLDFYAVCETIKGKETKYNRLAICD